MTSDDTNSSEINQDNAKLRENFLRAIGNLIGEKCTILTYEQSFLKATFSGWKPDGSEVLVTELMTPAKVQIDAALLRSPDVLSITFDRPVTLP